MRRGERCWVLCLCLVLVQTANGGSSVAHRGGSRRGEGAMPAAPELRTALTDLQAGKLAEFMEMTNADGGTALGKLEKSGWNLELAVDNFLTSQCNPEDGHGSMNGREDDYEELELEEEEEVSQSWGREREGCFDNRGSISMEDDGPAMAGGQDADDEELAHFQSAIRESIGEQSHADIRQMREEQDRAYEESLALDQVKEMIRREAEERDMLERQQRESRLLEEGHVRREAREAALKELEKLRMGLECEPEAGTEGCANVVVRLPDGTRLDARRFAGGVKVQAIYDWCDLQLAEREVQGDGASAPARTLPPRGQYHISTNLPRRRLVDKEKTLESAGISGQVLLILEPRAG